jgi:hypothetical protein
MNPTGFAVLLKDKGPALLMEFSLQSPDFATGQYNMYRKCLESCTAAIARTLYHVLLL